METQEKDTYRPPLYRKRQYFKNNISLEYRQLILKLVATAISGIELDILTSYLRKKNNSRHAICSKILESPGILAM